MSAAQTENNSGTPGTPETSDQSKFTPEVIAAIEVLVAPAQAEGEELPETQVRTTINGELHSTSWASFDDFQNVAETETELLMHAFAILQTRTAQALHEKAELEAKSSKNIERANRLQSHNETLEREIKDARASITEVLVSLQQARAERDDVKAQLARAEASAVESETAKLIRIAREAIRGTASPAMPSAATLGSTPAPLPSALTSERMSIKEVNSRVPEPFVFKGSRNDFPSWFMRLKYRLAEAAHLYPTERQKLHYILSRTEGSGAGPITARMKDDSPHPYVRADEMLKDLQAAFGSFDSAQRAQRTVKAKDFPMRHNEDIDEFYTRFMSAVNEIPLYSSGSGAEAAKTDLFRNNLTTGIQQAIAVLDDSLGFDAICKAAFTTFGNHRPSANHGHGGSNSGNKRKSQGQEKSGIGDASKRPRHDPNSSRSKELKDRIRAVHLCLKCGEDDHTTRACTAPEWIPNTEITRKAEAKERQGNGRPPA